MSYKCGYDNVSYSTFSGINILRVTRVNIFLFVIFRRASVHVRLTNLGKLPGFFQLVQRLKLEARGKYGEQDTLETDRQYYTGVFDISNAERLGKSEVHLINLMVEGTAKLIQIEMQLENGDEVNIDESAKAD